MRSSFGVETVDELSRADFNKAKEFRAEVSRLLREYHIAGMNVYTSSRCTKDWKNK